MARRRSAALQRARELYNEARARGEFWLQDVRSALAEEIDQFQDEMRDGFLDKLVQQVDRESVRDLGGELPLYPGWDLEGVYRLGENRRVDKSLAHLDHMEQMIENDEENTAAILEASRRKHEELRKLRPYLGSGRNKREAVEAYLRDNPGDMAG